MRKGPVENLSKLGALRQRKPLSLPDVFELPTCSDFVRKPLSVPAGYTERVSRVSHCPSEGCVTHSSHELGEALPTDGEISPVSVSRENAPAEECEERRSMIRHNVSVPCLTQDVPRQQTLSCFALETDDESDCEDGSPFSASLPPQMPSHPPSKDSAAPITVTPSTTSCGVEDVLEPPLLNVDDSSPRRNVDDSSPLPDHTDVKQYYGPLIHRGHFLHVKPLRLTRKTLTSISPDSPLRMQSAHLQGFKSVYRASPSPAVGVIHVEYGQIESPLNAHGQLSSSPVGDSIPPDNSSTHCSAQTQNCGPLHHVTSPYHGNRPKKILNVGIAFGGNSACSGVHNIVIGLHEYLQRFGTTLRSIESSGEDSDSQNSPSPVSNISPSSTISPLIKKAGDLPWKSFTDFKLFGFVEGCAGLMRGEYTELTWNCIKKYMNSPGCDMLGFKMFTPSTFTASPARKSNRARQGSPAVDAKQDAVSTAHSTVIQPKSVAEPCVLPPPSMICRRVLAVCDQLQLDYLVIIGGASDMDVAARLATYLLRSQTLASRDGQPTAHTKVLAVPACASGGVFRPVTVPCRKGGAKNTSDTAPAEPTAKSNCRESSLPSHSPASAEKCDTLSRDGSNPEKEAQNRNINYVPVTVGFESARSCLAEFCGNICSDSTGSKKYYHFLDCGSSLLTLEASLLVRPTLCLTSAEICGPEARGPNAPLPYWRLLDLRDMICEVVANRRRNLGKRSGTFFISSSLVDDLYEVHLLRDTVNSLLKHNIRISTPAALRDSLPTADLKNLFSSLPQAVQNDLTFSPPREGRALTHIEANRLLASLVDLEFKKRREAGHPLNVPTFNCHVINLAQEIKCPFPTQFDSSLGYGLGYCAGGLMSFGLTGYVATLRNLWAPVRDWVPCGVPLTCLMQSDATVCDFGRYDDVSRAPQVKCSSLDLEGIAFRAFLQLRESWQVRCHYRSPGPVQFGPNCGLRQPLILKALRYSNVARFADQVQCPSEEDERPQYPKLVSKLFCGSRSISQLSALQQERLRYEPVVPQILSSPFRVRKLDVTARITSSTSNPCLKSVFPCTYNKAALDVAPAHPHTEGGHMEMSVTTVQSRPQESFRDLAAESSPLIGDASATNSGRSRARLGTQDSIDQERMFTSAGWSVASKNECPLELNFQEKENPPVSGTSGIRLGICFNGRQTPGGLNVVCGVFDYLEKYCSHLLQGEKTPELVGILGGLLGLIEGYYMLINKSRLTVYRNQGGLDLICRTTEYFNTQADLARSKRSVEALKLTGLIMIGGFAATTNTALLSEYFAANDCKTAVLAVPLSVDGGLPFVEAPIGHDTACKVLASVIGNLMMEARSSRCWYFVRVSGRQLSHTCVECAVDTQPTIVLIPEEVEQKRMGVLSLTGLISDIAQTRAANGLNFGVLLLPDSLLSHVPEMHMLIQEVDSYFFGVDKFESPHEQRHTKSRTASDAEVFEIEHPDSRGDNSGLESSTPKGGLEGSSISWRGLAAGLDSQKPDSSGYEESTRELGRLRASLTPWSGALFESLPKRIQWQLAFKKDQSDRVDLGSIDTEVLLKGLVEQELSRRKSIGMFKKGVFHCKTHSLTYHGRSALPTNFDCNLGYTYGCLGAALANNGCNGFMAQVSNLSHCSPQHWELGAVPCTAVVRVSLVDQCVSSGVGAKSEKREECTRIECTPPLEAQRRGRQPTDLRHFLRRRGRGRAVERLSLSPEGHSEARQAKGYSAASMDSNETFQNVGALIYRVEGVAQAVDLEGPLFGYLLNKRSLWASTDSFRHPGPVQFWGDTNPLTYKSRLLNCLKFPAFNPTAKLKEISQLCSEAKSQCCTSASPTILRTAISSLRNLVEMLEILKAKDSALCRGSTFWSSLFEQTEGPQSRDYYDVRPLGAHAVEFEDCVSDNGGGGDEQKPITICEPFKALSVSGGGLQALPLPAHRLAGTSPVAMRGASTTAFRGMPLGPNRPTQSKDDIAHRYATSHTSTHQAHSKHSSTLKFET